MLVNAARTSATPLVSHFLRRCPLVLSLQADNTPDPVSLAAQRLRRHRAIRQGSSPGALSLNPLATRVASQRTQHREDAPMLGVSSPPSGRRYRRVSRIRGLAKSATQGGTRIA